jgi:TonB family protein
VTPAMEKAAMEAAKQFLFKPAKQRTVPVKARMAIPIRFKLHGN